MNKTIKIFIFTLILVPIVFTYSKNSEISNSGKISLNSFKENKGQVMDQFNKLRSDILFSYDNSNVVYFFKKTGISCQINKENTLNNKTEGTSVNRLSRFKNLSEYQFYRLDINWINANSNPIIEAQGVLPGYENYYTESCPNGAIGVKNYDKLIYKGLYDGIDLCYYTKDGQLKYDFLVSPGIDYTKIKIEIKGATEIFLSKDGVLKIKTPLGYISEDAPVVFQKGKYWRGNWKVKNNIVSFDIEGIDTLFPFIIDPLIKLWGSYFGGATRDVGMRSVCDAANNVYLSGETSSIANIATVGSPQTTYGSSNSNFIGDAFISKFNSNGVRQWATYYGGSGAESGNSCSVDLSSGNVYLIGQTTSTNSSVIATTGAHQANFNGGINLGDAFLVKFDSFGSRIWGTYYGGNGEDAGYGVDIDGNGNVFISGKTTTLGGNYISTSGGHQSIFGGTFDAFLVKFNSIGIRQWGTYYGGNNYDDALSCTVEANGNVYIVGETSSANAIATSGTHQNLFGGGLDAFIAKFNSNGIRLWGTYYGGSTDDWGFNCVCDISGNVYLAGTTACNVPTTISTIGSHQSIIGGVGSDCFLVKFNSNGSRIWGTYYGGQGVDHSAFCSIDPSGNIYLTGYTTTGSGTAIATPCTYQQVNSGNGDVFLAKFLSNGVRLWGTFIGGNGADEFSTCANDFSNNVYLCGRTSTKTGTVISGGSGYQVNYGGGSYDAFLIKFDGCIPLNPISTTSGSNLTICPDNKVSLSASATCGLVWYDSQTNNAPIGVGVTYTTPSLYTTTKYYIGELSCGTSTVRTVVEVTVFPKPNVFAGIDTVFSLDDPMFISATGASTLIWEDDESIYCKQCSKTQIFPTKNTCYVVNGVNEFGCRAKDEVCIELSRENAFYIPNTFTPNNDGLNDFFGIKSFGVLQYSCEIYNRWGDKIFASKDITEEWDGNFEGVECPQDVYVYRLTIKTDNRTYTRAGHVNLLR